MLTMLTGVPVRLAMRRNPVRMAADQDLDRAISCMVKFKVSSVLINEGSGGQDLGLITKTDLMTMYYAQLPLSTPLGEVLVAPVLTCQENDGLETALSRMLEQEVKRIYVCDDAGQITGVLASTDIVGLLYRVCSRCDKRRFLARAGEDTLLVRDVMHPRVVSCDAEQTIAQAMEVLSVQPFSALCLQTEKLGTPGVLSTSDLMLAYKHNVSLIARAMDIGSFPALSCALDEPLTQVLGRMMIADVHRLFVHGQDPYEVQGVLSLTDIARARSGSCKACTASRV